MPKGLCLLQWVHALLAMGCAQVLGLHFVGHGLCTGHGHGLDYYIGHGPCMGHGLTLCWPWAMHGSWLGLYLPWALAGHGLKLWIRMDLIGEVAMGSVRSW